MTRDFDNKTSELSQKVMDRIMEENRWVQPVHEQKRKNSKSTRTILSIITIILLLGVSISFIFINPSSKGDLYISNDTENIITSVRTLDFAVIFSDLDFIVVDKSVVTGTGEPSIYIKDNKKENNHQLSWMLLIFGLALLILVVSWATRSNDDADYT